MIDPLVNYGSQPLVTTVVVTHPGDIKLLPRALASLRSQLPQGQLEVLVMHDGPIDNEGADTVEGLPKDYDFALDFSQTPVHSGYYCVARNRSMELARGLYISHMDADNEYGPNHLRALLEAVRVPDPEQGWPHFAYTRRTYVKDQDDVGREVPVGETPLIPWTPVTVGRLLKSPQGNFIDTGDMLVGRSVLFELAERTGYVWNTECRRYGDYDLITRMIGCNFRGRPVDQATNIYHWTGSNLQLTRGLSEIQVIPADIYEKLKAEGKMI